MVQDHIMVSVLSDFARTLTTDFPIQGILDHLVGQIVDVLPVTGAGVTVISPGSVPRYIAASSTDALSFELLQTDLAEGPCVVAYDTGEAVSAPDLAGDVRFPGFATAAAKAGLRAVFALPLRSGGGQLGALDLYRDTPGDLHARDLAAAQTLADVAAAYLLNAQARAQALEVSERHRDRSMHDPLTGLPNRVLLQERLEHAAKRAHRSHTQAAVLFVDLDRFKVVNDAHGHGVGDELLVSVASRLATVVRPGDTLARVSGDEFIILCEDLADVQDVTSLARRIGRAFDRPFVTTQAELRMTASVGVAYAGPGEAVPDQLITHADQAMYEAKRLGGGTHQLVDLRGSPVLTAGGPASRTDVWEDRDNRDRPAAGGDADPRFRTGQAPRASPVTRTEGDVTRAFVALASSLANGHDVVDLLAELTTDCARLLDVASAGLLLADEHGVLHVMAASSERTRALEILQVQREDGPCRDSYLRGEAISVPDLDDAVERWPLFVPAARAAGFASLHALPMRLGNARLGTLGLFGAATGALNAEDLSLGQALADVASVALVSDRAVSDRSAINEQLQTALNSRVVLEQAKGILSQQGGLEMEQAFFALRRYARDHNVRLGQLAQAVATRQLPGTMVLDHLRSRART